MSNVNFRFLLKKGAMRFTENRERVKYTNLAIHALRQPQPFLTLAEILAARMRQLNDGRLWMGAHMRRGDCEWTKPFLLPTSIQ